MSPKDKLVKAKVSLLISQPWFGQLSCYLDLYETSKIDSACINERGNLYFNPKFINSLSDRELKGLVCHEILHLAYQHPFRIQHRDHEIFNIAADLKVNDDLKNAGDLEAPKVGIIPEHGSWSCSNAKIDNIEKKTTEQIYEELKKQSFKIPKFMLDLMGNSKKGVEEVDAKELPGLSREWQARVDAASSVEKGDIPAGLLRDLKALEYPELPWYQIIRQRLKAMSKATTWKKPNKRYLPWFFPGTERRKGLSAAIAIDTSGSMSTEQLTKALSEVYGMAQSFRSIKFYIITCDAAVWDVLELKNGNKEMLRHIKMKGGGGTDFRPVFKLIHKEYRNKIDCLVFFTDGYGDFPDKQPFYPVYWVTDSRDVKFPFGRVIYLKEQL